eukprot:Seg5543.1 transcript_id=Seg5543.1/GoldUCD/mRNA.D3Y31 product="Mitogen-activated protein kinase kinase kinase 13-B" protein_id=Seg5543.1/GoldUCD/D3Y31
MFKFPQLSKVPKKKSEEVAVYRNLPCFNWNHLENITFIGAGGYGKVFKAGYKNSVVVAKQLKGADESALIKEARFHHQLSHENIVNFISICPSRKALMLEYICFDFGPFGLDAQISSLQELLEVLGKANCKGFEHFAPCIASEVVSGLLYLHDHGVAHRDLKPGNVLVTNAHLIKLPASEMQAEWKRRPCIAKLTDFGESWGILSQSTEAAHTHTINVYRGTPAFMAPEIIDPLQRPYLMREEDMKKADIWSLGMLMFCLINPNCKLPYGIEGKSAMKYETFLSFVKKNISKGIKPLNDPEYDALRASNWANLSEVYDDCLKKKADDRVSMQQIKETLNQIDCSESYPLKVHQGTARIEAEERCLFYEANVNFVRPENDGTNACVFLSLKIAEAILSKKDQEFAERKSKMESIITNFPKKVNPLRNDAINLQELLEELGKANCKGFEHFAPCIASEVVSGLSYLHDHGVAHRDLKPGNVLVTNAHLIKLPASEMQAEWKRRPCIAKLTDFGESWGILSQSTEAAHTHTINVYRGTPAFMAPEIIDPLQRPYLMREEDMKKADIWNLGMLMFCLINPNCKLPYGIEGKSAMKYETFLSFVKKNISKGIKPLNDPEYDALRASNWANLSEVHDDCLKKKADDRVSMQQIKETLNQIDCSESYPLKVHQGTARIEAEERCLFNEANVNFVRPENDGTNACVFLSLKIAEAILSKEYQEFTERKSKMESIITNFPKKVNPLRNDAIKYAVDDAYELLYKEKLIAKCRLETLNGIDAVFSDAGKADLIKALGTEGNTIVITVPDYTFVAANLKGRIGVIDSHVISEEMGGNGNGIIKIFLSSNDASKWIWKRLYQSGIRTERQSLVQIQLAEADKSQITSTLNFTTQVPYHCIDLDSAPEKNCPQDCSNIPSDVEVSAARGNERVDCRTDMEHSASIHEFEAGVVHSNSETSEASEAQGEDQSLSTNEVDKPNYASSFTWNKAEVSHWGPSKIPFVKDIRNKLLNSEVYALTMSTIDTAKKIPQACRQNSVFSIDSTVLADVEDVKSDLNGPFKKCIEAKVYTVQIAQIKNKEYLVKAISKKRVDSAPGHTYMKVNRRENSFGLVRSITHFMDGQGKILNGRVIVQYYINRQICGDVQSVNYTVPAHGNSKKEGSFYALKKSTLGNLGTRLLENDANPNSVYEKILSERGAESGLDFGDLPRSKRQITRKAADMGLSKNSRQEYEVEAILAYDHELEENGIVWAHSDIPNDLWVIGTSRMANILKSAGEGLPISIDPTFNHGAYEVTPVT